MLYGRQIPMQELVERLSAITPERIRDLAERLFATKPTVAAIGPVGALPAFETLRESLAGPTPSMRRLAG
jgi:predicted Zn-dependent peptidase